MPIGNRSAQIDRHVHGDDERERRSNGEHR
jgi:hypothetical protein